MPEYLLLVIREGPGGRLEVASGLPADRDARLSAVYRLLDGLAVVAHQDAEAAGLSHGQAWQKFAKDAYYGWLHSDV